MGQVQRTHHMHCQRNAIPEQFNVGSPDYRCQYCGAYFWHGERCKKQSKANNPRYNLCCREGRVSLPNLREPPLYLDVLLDPNGFARLSNFKEKICLYNPMFAFTSMGVKVDETINDGSVPYVFKVAGQAYHRIGSRSNYFVKEENRACIFFSNLTMNEKK